MDTEDFPVVPATESPNTLVAMPQDEHRTVIVAGAGPVGCAAALFLSRRGIDTLILEREADLPEDLRASTFHPVTLDMLDELDLTPELMRRGLICQTFQYRDRRTGEYALFDLSLLADETRHPFRLQVEQYKMTRIVRDRLNSMELGEMRFRHRVESARDDGERVSVEVSTPDGPRTLTCDYLIGSEGAGSNVRKSNDIDFEGFTYPERFLVASTDFDFAMVFPGLSMVNYVSDPDEWCVMLKTPTLWRVLVPTDPDADEQELLSDDFVQARLQHLVRRPEDYFIGHRTLYRVHQRVAETYRKGRILLAGDAAHINNPLGGMGMNGGLHDAINLAEKLAAVILEGADPDAALDHYDRQRRQICLQFVQKHTIQNKKLMEAKEEDVQAERQAHFMRVAGNPELAKEFMMDASMINAVRDSYAIQ